MNAPRELVLLAGAWPEAISPPPFRSLEDFASKVFLFTASVERTGGEQQAYQVALRNLSSWKERQGLSQSAGFADLVMLPYEQRHLRGIVWMPYHGIHARYPKEYQGPPAKEFRAFSDRLALAKWLQWHKPENGYLIHPSLFKSSGERYQDWLLLVLP